MLKNQVMLRVQKSLVISIVMLAVILLVFSLGFMTNFHVLMFDGTFEMFEYYKSLQVLIRSMFNISLMYVIFAFSLLAFDYLKEYPSIFGWVWAVAGSVYSIVKSISMFKYVPYFKNLYLTFDYSIMEGYTRTEWMFDLARGLFLVWDVVLVITVFVVTMNYWKKITQIRNEQG